MGREQAGGEGEPVAIDTEAMIEHLVLKVKCLDEKRIASASFVAIALVVLSRKCPAEWR